MKPLLFTNKVDKNDSEASFFYLWITGFAKHFDSVIVVCLEEGEHDLPDNVRVLSLGKEERQSRLQYLIHFYWYILHERKNYDVVFSYMNQEYIVLGGMIWRIMRKKMFLWRDSRAGNMITRLAGSFCKAVFHVSNKSYVANFKNAVMIPVEVDSNPGIMAEKIKKLI